MSKHTQHSYEPSRSSRAIISDCSRSDTPRKVVGDLIDDDDDDEEEEEKGGGVGRR